MSGLTPSTVRDAGNGLLDLLFPRVCGLCGRPDVDRTAPVCEACHARVQAARAVPHCTRCGATVGPYGGVRQGCPFCRTLPIAATGFARVGPFLGDLAALVRSYKFRGAAFLDRYVGELLAETIRTAPWFNEIDVLTWVPTCWQHRLRRRFHATSAAAPHVARSTGLPMLPLLRRVKGGPHQIGLSAAARMENVKGKFKVARGVAFNRTTVCVIDDVATTGATVNECARVLKRAGASKVYVAVVGRAGGPDRVPRDA